MYYIYREDIVNTKKFFVNKSIRASNIRLIGANGEMLGIVKLNEALLKAKAAELDLVEVSSQGDTSVCKIVDFSKFKYKMERKAKEGKRKQKVIQLKEIRIRPKIGEYDLSTKINRIKLFLCNGNKVQISVVFSGRESQHKNLGSAVLDKVKLAVDNYIVEPKTSYLGNRMFMILNPKKNIAEKKKE
ncbi:MAG: translation initiation factor IF-3 [Endomicrobium sp.]|jgi:translation initiation factor IF-3|nr:translation initiation factor IF-3 [Endomicrobium sp.]